jgi:hypothetical protein
MSATVVCLLVDLQLQISQHFLEMAKHSRKSGQGFTHVPRIMPWRKLYTNHWEHALLAYTSVLRTCNILARLCLKDVLRPLVIRLVLDPQRPPGYQTQYHTPLSRVHSEEHSLTQSYKGDGASKNASTGRRAPRNFFSWSLHTGCGPLKSLAGVPQAELNSPGSNDPEPHGRHQNQHEILFQKLGQYPAEQPRVTRSDYLPCLASRLLSFSQIISFVG